MSKKQEKDSRDEEESGEQKMYTVLYDGETEPKQYITKDGNAKVKYPNGDEFAGSFVNGKKSGKGKYTYASGASYEGTYVDGVKSGAGTFIFKDKSKYVGEFKNDKFNGQGTYYYTNGDRYCGAFENGLKHGKGTYIHNASESEITGEWKQGQVVTASWKFHDGTVYTGQFVENKPEGDGVYKFANGNEQKGKYKNDQWVGGEVVLAAAK